MAAASQTEQARHENRGLAGAERCCVKTVTLACVHLAMQELVPSFFLFPFLLHSPVSMSSTVVTARRPTRAGLRHTSSIEGAFQGCSAWPGWPAPVHCPGTAHAQRMLAPRLRCIYTRKPQTLTWSAAGLRPQGKPESWPRCCRERWITGIRASSGRGDCVAAGQGPQKSRLQADGGDGS